jgi:hypothetical protein
MDQARGRETITERRKNRSDSPLEAANLYLRAAVQGQKVHAVAIANEDGFLVAATGQGYDLQGLASLGPVYGGDGIGHCFPEALVDDVTHGDDLYASALEVCGETFYVTSIGARLPRQRETEVALQRILAPALLA